MQWYWRPMSKKQQRLQRHKQQQINRHKQTHLSTKPVAWSEAEAGAAKLTAGKLDAAAVVDITAATATALANLKLTVLAKATTSLGRHLPAVWVNHAHGHELLFGSRIMRNKKPTSPLGLVYRTRKRKRKLHVCIRSWRFARIYARRCGFPASKERRLHISCQ
jgi:hypothetical protein